MNGRAMVLMLGGCLGVVLWASDAFAADPAAELRVFPHGYRHLDLGKSLDRTYGGYWWTSEDGAVCEEGITIEGRPLVCTSDTMLVVNAATAEAADIHFVDGDIRRTWVASGSATGLHLFSELCSKDPLVGRWGRYVPVYLRYKPGVFLEDVRQPGYTETFGARHSVGALAYDTLRAKASTVEVRQTWYVASKWSVVNEVEVRNLTGQADPAASIAVAMDLRSPVSTDRNQLNWFADFHSGGKAGVPEVPRLSDDEYHRLVKLLQFQVEYREADCCIVAQTGCDVRAAKPTYYFACLMLGAPVAGHVIAAAGDARQSKLFAAGTSYPRQLSGPRGVIGLRSQSFPLGAKEARTLKYAIAFGRTADEAVANARQGLAVEAAEAVRKTDEYWTRRLPAIETGNATLNPILRYAAITQDVNWEPDGRVAGDLGGWGRSQRAEVCGYKNYYDQSDMVVPILDVPVYDPELFKKALLYDVDPQTGRLRKCIIWRQQYDNMLYWPSAAYKVWMATRDDEFLKKMCPVLDNTLRWLQESRTEPDGLLRMLTMPYDIFTIGLGDDRPVMTKAQAVACDGLRAMARMARHLNRVEDAAFYEKWLAQIRKATNQRLWRNAFYSFSLDFPDHLCLSGNCCAITAGLADPQQSAAICRQIEAMYTGGGFPNVHPPLPGWVGSAPYQYQNGDMYVDQLALIARAANKAGNPQLLSHVLFEFKRLVQRHKCFPVTGHPWNANMRMGVNEIHSASGLIAAMLYGAAGVEEGEDLRFRPLMVPEVGGRVVIRNLLYQGTRFDVRIEGQGNHVRKITVDKAPVSGPAIPPAHYDGKTHQVVIEMEAP